MSPPKFAPDFAPGFSPRSDVAVIIACDARYLPYAAVPALQLAAQPARGFDVLIGSQQRVELPQSLASAGIASFGAVDPDLAGSLPGDARRSLATYMDVFAARAMAGVYRRILVLDADVVIDGGDPARLMSADMRGRAIAAVRDNRQWRNPGKLAPEFRTMGWKAAPYFNAGVVMADPAAWVAQDLPARSAAFARDHLARLGRDLHERLSTMGQHLDRVGRSLRGAVTAYNAAVGSLEGRVLVTARRFGELGVTDDELATPGQVELLPRSLGAPELTTDLTPDRTVSDHDDPARRARGA